MLNFAKIMSRKLPFNSVVHIGLYIVLFTTNVESNKKNTTKTQLQLINCHKDNVTNHCFKMTKYKCTE